MHSVRISSASQQANFSVIDEDGVEVAKGTTPDTVELRTSSAPFKAARYEVNFDIAGKAAKTNLLKARFSGWYFVNLFASYPGLLGLLIIDPFTGALYRLPDESRMTLDAPLSTKSLENNADPLSDTPMPSSEQKNALEISQ